MASTEVKRKAARNKSRAKARVATIKRLNGTPIIRKITAEEVEAQFAAAKPAKKATKKAAPKAEKETEKTKEAAE
jgi:hypothetical protein